MSTATASTACSGGGGGIRFQRHVGAAADAKELEYVSALLQTGRVIRDNGLVSSVDVQRLLSSRYGILVSRHQAHGIVNGLAGTTRSEAALQDMILQRRQKRQRTKGNQHDSAEKIKIKNSISKVESLAGTSAQGCHLHTSSVVEPWEQPVVATDANPPEPAAAAVSAAPPMADNSNVQDHMDDADSDDNEVPEAYLDTVQLAAVLLIPTLAQAAHDYDYNSHHDVESTVSPSPVKDVDLRDQIPANLLTNGLQMILKNLVVDQGDGDSNEWPPRVTVDLIQAILLDIGERELVQDLSLVQSMATVATSASGRLDEDALRKALTHDIGDWHVAKEGQLSTMFYDVFGQEDQIPGSRCVETSQTGKNDVDEEELIAMEDPNHASKTMADHNNIRMIDHTSIDFVVDSHSSINLVIMIWVFYILMTLSYIALARTLVNVPCEKFDADQPDSFGCIFASVLWQWLVFAVFATLFGLVIMAPLSAGNAARGRKPGQIAVIIAVTIIYIVVPPLIVRTFKDDVTEPLNAHEALVDDPFWLHLQRTTLVSGAILLCGFCFHFVLSLVRMPDSASGFIQQFTATSNTIGDFRLKRAASRKVNAMLRSAMSLHSFESGAPLASSLSMTKLSNKQQSMDRTMLAYVLKGSRTELVGGVLWTIKGVYSGELFNTEGLWIPTRVLVFQTAQIVVGILLGYSAIVFTDYLAQLCEKARAELPQDSPDWLRRLVPTKQNIQIAFYPADFVSLVVIVLLISVYIPSTCSTIMKYRSGQLPTLGSSYFQRYRTAIDTTHMNTGNAIYGLLGASLLFWGLVAVFIFLFIWDFSQVLMLRVLGWGLGLSLTMLFKTILTKTCRRSSRGFYRTHPRSYNITTLALECWFIGLGASVLIGRVFQFLLAAAFWVGRIDVPYLSQNVNLGGYAFDSVPIHFAKELLVHEAHRHPYIERITQMCLMRIKSETFLCPAGAAWRRVFVQAFMPWLKKYREFQEARIYAALSELEYRQEELEEDSKNIASRFLEDIRENAAGVASGVGSAGEHIMTGTTAMFRGARERNDTVTHTGRAEDVTANNVLGSMSIETLPLPSNTCSNSSINNSATSDSVGMNPSYQSERQPHQPREDQSNLQEVASLSIEGELQMTDPRPMRPYADAAGTQF